MYSSGSNIGTIFGSGFVTLSVSKGVTASSRVGGVTGFSPALSKSNFFGFLLVLFFDTFSMLIKILSWTLESKRTGNSVDNF